MRPVVLGCAVSLSLSLAGCSRNPPSPEARGPSPAPTLESAQLDTTPASLRLATALDEAADASASAPPVAPPPPPPSLAGKTVLHVGDSMVGGNLGLTRALEQRF